MNALPDPELRHVYRLDAELDAPVDLGDTPQGHRRIIPITRGQAAGRYFDAELLPAGGADWQIVRASGSWVADIRYTLKTDGGALLYVQSQGLRHGDPERDAPRLTYVYVSRVALDGCVHEMGPNHGSFATSALVSPFEWQNPEPLTGAPNARTPARAGVLRVELGGLEPPTSWVRSRLACRGCGVRSCDLAGDLR